MTLLPTPTTSDGSNCGGGSQHDRNSPPLNAVVTMIELVGTPTAGLGMGGGRRSQSFNGDKSRKPNPVEPADEIGTSGWGKYASAIDRWAQVMDRPAPDPTDGQGRLNPALVEWMMGYPEGWVDGISRTGQLKALGNAIVPHQAAAAWGHLIGLDVATVTGPQALLPTPAAWDGDRGPDYARAGRDGSGGDDLVTTVARMTRTT